MLAPRLLTIPVALLLTFSSTPVTAQSKPSDVPCVGCTSGALPSCPDRCDALGSEIAACGTEDDCAAQSRASVHDCLLLHCGDAPPPCEKRCDGKAARAERLCLSHSATAKHCAEARSIALQSCRDERCVPPPPQSCSTACEAHAQEITDQCLVAAVDPATCDAEGQSDLDACLSQCGAAPPPTCAQQCELQARGRYYTMLTRHHDQRGATRRAQYAFRRCTRSCATPDRSRALPQDSPRLSPRDALANNSGATSPMSSKLPRCLQPMTSRPLLADYATYIAANTNVQRAMNPCKISTGILNWFFAKLEAAEQAGAPPSAPLPAAFSTTSTVSYVWGGAQTDEILGAKLAHILYIEVRNKVPWRLANYSSADLKRIFTLCKWPHPCSHDSIADFAAQYVLDYSPAVAWSVLGQVIDLSALVNQRQAVADILKHTRAFIHGGVYYDSAGNIVADDSWGIRTLDQMMSEKISRHGCWSMVPYAMQLVAAVNIPVDGISDYYAGLGHATAVFPMTDQVLAHGDDVYRTLLKETPSALVLDSFIRWQKEVLAYQPGSQTAAYNADKHDKDMARVYPSSDLMRNYCSPGSAGRAYLEAVFTTYATAPQLDSLQATIATLTNNCSVVPADSPDNPATL